MNLAWHDGGQLVGHRKEGASSHSPHIIIHILQTSQDGGREEGQQSGTQVLKYTEGGREEAGG